MFWVLRWVLGKTARPAWAVEGAGKDVLSACWEKHQRAAWGDSFGTDNDVLRTLRWALGRAVWQVSDERGEGR